MRKAITALSIASLLASPLAVAAPANAASAPSLSYAGYVHGSAWQAPVAAPQPAGTTGKSLSLEGFKVAASGVSVQAHTQNIGWGPRTASPAAVGAPGRGLRIEALRLASTTSGWKIRCQAHVATIGWLPAVGDGETCGTTGRSLGIEAVKVWVVPAAATPAPSETITYSVAQPVKTRPTSNNASVRSAPSSSASVLGVAQTSYDIELTGTTSGTWSQVRWRTGLGWMPTSMLKVTRPAGPTVTITVPRSAPVSPTSKAGLVLSYLNSKLGKGYVWAGTGPDAFDCSGLTQAAYRNAGIAMPRVSSEQATKGTPVAFGAWKPGDLLAWGTPVHHVGIYVGDGMMISAKGGAWGVYKESVAEHNAYSPDYSGARRIA